MGEEFVIFDKSGGAVVLGSIKNRPRQKEKTGFAAQSGIQTCVQAARKLILREGRGAVSLKLFELRCFSSRRNTEQ